MGFRRFTRASAIIEIYEPRNVASIESIIRPMLNLLEFRKLNAPVDAASIVINPISEADLERINGINSLQIIA